MAVWESSTFNHPATCWSPPVSLCRCVTLSYLPFLNCFLLSTTQGMSVWVMCRESRQQCLGGVQRPLRVPPTPGEPERSAVRGEAASLTNAVLSPHSTSSQTHASQVSSNQLPPSLGKQVRSPEERAPRAGSSACSRSHLQSQAPALCPVSNRALGGKVSSREVSPPPTRWTRVHVIKARCQMGWRF